MNKQCVILISSLALTGTLWAATPTPNDAITQLLTHIETNTANTATATSNTLNTTLQSMTTAAQQTATTQQNDAKQYVYATATHNQFADGLDVTLSEIGQAQTNVNAYVPQYASENIFTPLMCSNPLVNNSGICQPGNQQTKAAQQFSGTGILNQTLYRDTTTPTQYLQSLFVADIEHATNVETPELKLASEIASTYVLERMPLKNNSKTPTSYMSQLTDMVKVPMSTQWQTTLDNASQSDRIRTLISLTALNNYLALMRLKAQQKTNLLLAASISQRVKLTAAIRTQTQQIGQLVTQSKKS